MENEIENLDSLNEGTENLDSQNEEALEAADVEALKEKAKKLEEQNKQLFERAKKAEQEAKKNKPAGGEEPPKKEEYSLEDTVAIITDKVTEKDDIEIVKKFAKLENISIAEALKSPIVKTILSTKAEERKTAQATNTGGGRKGSSKVTGDEMIERALQGQMPEDDEGIKNLAEARLQQKLDALNANK